VTRLRNRVYLDGERHRNIHLPQLTGNATVSVSTPLCRR